MQAVEECRSEPPVQDLVWSSRQETLPDATVTDIRTRLPRPVKAPMTQPEFVAPGHVN